MKEETKTVAVRLPLPVYNTLADACEASDHERMSDLLRAILHAWAQWWVDND